jgi:hypothetical protein
VDDAYEREWGLLAPDLDNHTPEFEVRKRALNNLWRSVTGSLDFRHPDPNVHVEIVTKGIANDDRYIRINIEMRNLRDTRDLDRIQSSNEQTWAFGMPLDATLWPGRRLAEVALAGTWVAYLSHETLELAQRRPMPGDPAHMRRALVDPHGMDADCGYICDIVERAFRGRYTDLDKLLATAGLAVGRERADAIWAACRGRAELDMRNEVAHVTGLTEVWQ